MSADNGVYILATKGPQFRVKHLQAIENVYWPDGSDSKVHIANARKMWAGCKPFSTRTNALKEADKILSSLDTCEYGISVISIDEKF